MPTTSSLPTRRFTLLVVEEDLPDVRLTTEWLTREGGRGPVVLDATSITEARAVLAVCRVDAIILDLGWPDVSGTEALSAIVDTAPGVPVIVLTASDDDALDLRLLHLGATDFVRKGPAEGELLRRTVHYAIERARAEKAREDLEHFASLISHDLSGPIHTVHGFLELLEVRAGDSLGEKEREYVANAAEAATRASTRLAELVAEARQRAREASPA